MTTKEKQNWLENAGAEELLNHYNSTLRRYEERPLEGESIEDWELTRAEMIKRLSR